MSVHECPQNILDLGSPCPSRSAFCSGLQYKFQPTSVSKSNFGPVLSSVRTSFMDGPLPRQSSCESWAAPHATFIPSQIKEGLADGPVQEVLRYSRSGAKKPSA